MEIEWYTLKSGVAPARVYLDALDKRLRSKTLRTIGLLEQYGNRLMPPDSKHLEDGIFELRTTMGNNAGRVMYFFFANGTAVLTHGFVKKTQKTPRKEIDRAKRYRADYYDRANRREETQ